MEIDNIFRLNALVDASEDLSTKLEYAEEPKVVAPGWMKSAAKRGLKIRDAQTKSNKCCLPTGLKRADMIIKGQQLSQSTLKRMKSFAARHGSQLTKESEPNSKLRQALLIWGVPDSAAGVKKFISWVDSKLI
jgi:hypothetical protein